MRGGGASTRELEALDPRANADGPTALLLTGGSAFGLAAADGVVRWMAERGLGRGTQETEYPQRSIQGISMGNTGAKWDS